MRTAQDLRAWLASGELQTADGAFRAWRDGLTSELAFAYPEITGYALTWLAGRDIPTAQEIAVGRRAADWVTQRLEGGDRSARSGWDGEAVYAFDLGVIAAGLMSFGRRHGTVEHVGQGERTAAELSGLLRGAGLSPVLTDGPPTSRTEGWSTAGKPHLVKCVQALLLVQEHDAARALIGTAAAWEREAGRFQTQPDDAYTMLHPHLYTVEGLWIWGTATGDPSALARARRSTEWAWRHQLPSGGLPRSVSSGGEPSGPEQWDVTSQAVRAAIITGADISGLDRAIDRLLGLARKRPIGKALVYQPGVGQEHYNAWVSMFGAQALELAAGEPEVLAWHALV